MGRAIVRKPRVFLMDEPLSNLDAQLRVQMRADIAELQARLGVTTVYVTHDQAEAMTLGHRVAVLKDARLQQCDTPRELFDRPGEHVRGRLRRLARDEPVPRAARRRRRGRVRRDADRAAARTPATPVVIVGVRPEALELAADGLAAGVEAVEELGSDAFIYCAAELGGAPVRLVGARRRARTRPRAASACTCARARSTRRTCSTPTPASASACVRVGGR